MTGSSVQLGFIDKRISQYVGGVNTTRIGDFRTIFTANAVGTNTTLVGVNAAPGTDDTNVVRRVDRFRLYDTNGNLKEDTVFLISGVAVAASTTITFNPPAQVPTAVGDVAKLVDIDDYSSIPAIDARLMALAPTYTQGQLDQMTVNDKIWALRQTGDAGSI